MKYHQYNFRPLKLPLKDYPHNVYAYSIPLNRILGYLEEDLAKVLSERNDITAILDVTWPEPPVEGHPFYSLPNCILTPHIAGSMGNETHRMAYYMIEQLDNCLNGKETQYEVTKEMLSKMA